MKHRHIELNSRIELLPYADTVRVLTGSLQETKNGLREWLESQDYGHDAQRHEYAMFKHPRGKGRIQNGLVPESEDPGREELTMKRFEPCGRGSMISALLENLQMDPETEYEIQRHSKSAAYGSLWRPKSTLLRVKQERNNQYDDSKLWERGQGREERFGHVREYIDGSYGDGEPHWTLRLAVTGSEEQLCK